MKLHWEKALERERVARQIRKELVESKPKAKVKRPRRMMTSLTLEHADVGEMILKSLRNTQQAKEPRLVSKLHLINLMKAQKIFKRRHKRKMPVKLQKAKKAPSKLPQKQRPPKKRRLQQLARGKRLLPHLAKVRVAERKEQRISATS